MAWPLIAAVVGSVASKYLGGTRKGGDLPATPDYFEDPNFTSNQEFGKNYFQDWLKGNIPDYWKQIGMPSDQNMLNQSIYEKFAPTMQAANEQAAQMGTGRSPVGRADVMQSLGNANASWSLADYLAAMERRKGLLDFGGAGYTDVTNAGAWNMGQKNAFNQWGYGVDLAKENQLQDRRDKIRGETKQMIGSISNAVGSYGLSSYLGGLAGGNNANSVVTNNGQGFGNYNGNFTLPMGALGQNNKEASINSQYGSLDINKLLQMFLSSMNK